MNVVKKNYILLLFTPTYESDVTQTAHDKKKL
jgi:hypothetical protein